MKTTTKVKTTIVGALSTVLLSTPMEALADHYSGQIRAQLLATALAVSNGFNLTPSHEPSISTLRANRHQYVTVNLRGGKPYAFIGVCDSNCSDLDLHLYDENNNLIAVDRNRDDLPVVSVTPRWSGQFKVKVTMDQCWATSCYYGVGVFSR